MPALRSILSLLIRVSFAVLAVSCGGSEGSDAGMSDVEGGVERPRFEPTDPCLVAGYHFDGASDCDVVRCPEIRCSCSGAVDAGVSRSIDELTLSACVPDVGCLMLVDCERACDPSLQLVREACEGRISRAGAQRCEDDDDCGGECREESVGPVCVDRFRCAEGGHCGRESQCLFGPERLDEEGNQPQVLGDCSDGLEESVCYADEDCLTGRCFDNWCTSGMEGASCLEDHHCASGFCRDWGTEGVCVSGQPGGACTDDGDCDEGLHCTNSICYSDEVGQHCETADQCASGICVAGRCRSGELGARCDDPADCSSGFCTSGHCSSGGLLAPCAETEDCGDGLECVRQRCSDGTDGMPCTTVDDCSVLACVRNACSDGANGSTCATDEQCQSGRCANPAGATPGDCTSGEPGSRCVTGANCVSGSCASQICN